MFIKITRHSIALGVMLLLWGTGGRAQAQTAEDGLRLSQRAPATGARMTGLGTAGYGGFGDYTALYGNPAGLGLVRESSLTGAINITRMSDASDSQTNGFSASNLTKAVGSTNLGNFAWLYKAPTTQGTLVLGFTFNQVESYSRELRFSGDNTSSSISTSFLPYSGEYMLNDEGGLEELDDFVFSAFNGGFIEYFPELLEDDPDAYPFLEAVVPGTKINQRGRVTEEGRMREASFGGSIEIARELLVGASLNVSFGRYALRSAFEEEDIYDQNTAEDYSVLQEDGSLLEGFDYLRYRQHVESDLLGVNLRLGVSKRILPFLRAGLTIETPMRIGIDESYGARYETHFDGGGILAYGHQPDDVGNGAFNYRLRTPWRLGAGISLQWEKLTLLADAEAVNWSRMRFRVGGTNVFEDLNEQISEDYGAVLNISGGAEVDLGKILVRAGASRRPDPIRLELRNSSGEIYNRDRLYLTGGLGYRISEKALMNVGWAMGSFNAAYLPYPVDAYGPRQDESLQIDESVTRHQIVVGVTYSL